MVPIGGVGVMLLGALAALVGLGLLGWLLGPRLGWVTTVAWVGLVWWLVVIALVTLVPAEGAPGIVPAESRLPSCAWDLGGPAPDGFWVFAGGQRLLNTMLFVPAGALVVIAAARWRSGWLLAPAGLGLVAVYSTGIEWTQLVLARLDRACDVTDVVDNVAGALLGCVVGLLLVPVLRPWHERRRRRPRSRTLVG